MLAYDPATGAITWRVARGKMAPGDIAGTADRFGYRHIRVDGVRFLAHRLALLIVTGSMPEGDVDHINGDPRDNRLINLRAVSRMVNQQNQRRPHKSGTSGHMGVTWDKRARRWKSAIRVDGASKHIGRYEDPAIAAKAYIEAKRRLHAGCSI